jgi:hypothetical protein
MDLADPSGQTPLVFDNTSGTSPKAAEPGVQTPAVADAPHSSDDTPADSTETANVPEGTKVVQAAPASEPAPMEAATAADTPPLAVETDAKSPDTHVHAAAETAASHKEGERDTGRNNSPKRATNAGSEQASPHEEYTDSFLERGARSSSDEGERRGKWSRRRRDPSPSSSWNEGAASEPTTPPREDHAQPKEPPGSRYAAAWKMPRLEAVNKMLAKVGEGVTPLPTKADFADMEEPADVMEMTIHALSSVARISVAQMDANKRLQQSVDDIVRMQANQVEEFRQLRNTDRRLENNMISNDHQARDQAAAISDVQVGVNRINAELDRRINHLSTSMDKAIKGLKESLAPMAQQARAKADEAEGNATTLCRDIMERVHAYHKDANQRMDELHALVKAAAAHTAPNTSDSARKAPPAEQESMRGFMRRTAEEHDISMPAYSAEDSEARYQQRKTAGKAAEPPRATAKPAATAAEGERAAAHAPHGGGHDKHVVPAKQSEPCLQLHDMEVDSPPALAGKRGAMLEFSKLWEPQDEQRERLQDRIRDITNEKLRLSARGLGTSSEAARLAEIDSELAACFNSLTKLNTMRVFDSPSSKGGGRAERKSGGAEGNTMPPPQPRSGAIEPASSTRDKRGDTPRERQSRHGGSTRHQSPGGTHFYSPYTPRSASPVPPRERGAQKEGSRRQREKVAAPAPADEPSEPSDSSSSSESSRSSRGRRDKKKATRRHTRRSPSPLSSPSPQHSSRRATRSPEPPARRGAASRELAYGELVPTDSRDPEWSILSGDRYFTRPTAECSSSKFPRFPPEGADTTSCGWVPSYFQTVESIIRGRCQAARGVRHAAIDPREDSQLWWGGQWVSPLLSHLQGVDKSPERRLSMQWRVIRDETVPRFKAGHNDKQVWHFVVAEVQRLFGHQSTYQLTSELQLYRVPAGTLLSDAVMHWSAKYEEARSANRPGEERESSEQIRVLAFIEWMNKQFPNIAVTSLNKAESGQATFREVLADIAQLRNQRITAKAPPKGEVGIKMRYPCPR